MYSLGNMYNGKHSTKENRWNPGKIRRSIIDVMRTLQFSIVSRKRNYEKTVVKESALYISL